MKKLTCRHTVLACYVGYFTQATAINFTPLLYITFRETYGISLSQVSLLIAINFLAQFLMDACAAGYARKIGYRRTTVLAHLLAAAGLVLLAVLPRILPPIVGLGIAVGVSGIGCGLIEVMVSPLLEACPIPNKAAAMSLLHSFYSWGQAAVILFSTLFFVFFGLENWYRLAVFWAVVPLVGAALFSLVPIYTLPQANERGNGIGNLMRERSFWLFLALMACAGAAETIMSQWASGFATAGLQVDKTLGDLLGPCAFAVLMGLSRVFYGKMGGRINLRRMMALSLSLCVLSYLLAALSPYPWLALVGCALCGLSVGILWPGTLSLAAGKLPQGGISLFALLALCGDFGCISGPGAAGILSDAFGGNLKVAFLFAIVFPLLALVALFAENKQKKKS